MSLEVCDTLKHNGVSTDAIRLRLFPFSLRDKARAWLHSLPSWRIITWDDLTRVFLTKFFPLSKTASLRNQITNFTQKDEEMLYEAWERFKDFRRLCPHHGLQHWMIIQAFYNGGMNLDNKTEDKPYNLIEEMALNNFLWSTKQG